MDITVCNSSGYFKDPVTKEDLSVDTPRVIPAELRDGKFIWPMVLSSDGENLLKIVYRYFTEEEKNLYKQYRGRPLSSEPRQNKPKQIIKEESVDVNTEPIVVTYTGGITDPITILTVLAQCDSHYGISFICGEMYCVVGNRASNKYYHIRRDLMPDDEWNRIYSTYYPEG